MTSMIGFFTSNNKKVSVFYTNLFNLYTKNNPYQIYIHPLAEA